MTPRSLSPESAAPDAPSAGADDMGREQRRYLTVYAVLVVGTVFTVAMYYVHFEALWHTVAVALLIAAAKATCVAAIFMHLWHGQRDVYKIVFYTGVIAAIMLALTTYSHYSLPALGHYVR
jgi:caa(3)-type oxidase subunit IV